MTKRRVLELEMMAVLRRYVWHDNNGRDKTLSYRRETALQGAL